MTRYLVLVTDDEAAWDRSSEEERQRVYEHDARFTKLLAERGHRVVGGAELAPSREARFVRTGRDGVIATTEGPFAETVEQIGGFYVVECDDVDDLLDACAAMAPGHVRLDLRPILGDTLS